ncbi:YadA-like family protein [Neisseria subflava]|uniref:YadA-like family protein n=3 Tax=Neisseria TaxID=482 RepID=A0A9X9HTE5_NEISU|nr:YadA-like family protein [Neisseria subflava]UTG69322.1 YadA-like family protein [Neisseria subflava]
MNKIFKVVWNRTIQSFVVTSELAKGRVKSSAEQNSTDVSAESGKNGIAAVFRLTVISAALLGAGNSYAATAGRGLIAVDPPTSATAVSGATATGIGALSVGASANATANGAVAVGTSANATHNNSLAVGTNAKATQNHAVAMGADTSASSSHATAIGKSANAVSADSTALGADSKANGTQATAVGKNALANNTNTTALGNSAQAFGIGSMALGQSSTSRGQDGIAIGSGSQAAANAQNAIAIGTNAVGYQSESIAIGNSTQAQTGNTIAIGKSAVANSPSSGSAPSSAIALGTDANATGLGTIAIGRASGVLSQNIMHPGLTHNNIAIGNTARVGDSSSPKITQAIAIGSGNRVDAQGRPEGAWAKGDQSIAVGGNVVAEGNSSISVGGDDLDSVGGTQYSGSATDKFIKYNAQGAKVGEYALRGKNLRDIYKEMTGDTMNSGVYGNTIAGQGSVALGVQSNSSADLSLAIGTKSQATAFGGVALGTGAKATLLNSVALGTASKTDKEGRAYVQREIMGVTYTWAGGQTTDAGDVVSVGSQGYERQIINVSPGDISATSTDAINGSQLYGVLNALERVRYFSVKSEEGKTDGTKNWNNDGAKATNSIAIGPNAATSTGATGSISLGHNANVLGSSSVAVGPNATVTSRTVGAVALGSNANSRGTGSIAIGLNTENDRNYSIVVGAHSRANYENATVVGARASAQNNGTAMGYLSNAVGDDSVAIGHQAQTAQSYSIAIGKQANSSGLYSTAIGSSAQAAGQNSFAGGNNAKATGSDSVALGSGATTTIGSSVALGNGAVGTANNFDATAKNATFKNDSGATTNVSYAASSSAKTGAVSVGSAGNERQIHNVAAGRISATSTDAVNGSQLYTVMNNVGHNIQQNGTDKSRINNNGTVNYADGNLTTVAVTDGENASKVQINVTQGTLSVDNNGTVSAPTAGVATAGDVANAINNAKTTTKVAAGSNTHVNKTTSGKETTYTVSADKATVQVSNALNLTSNTTTVADGAVTTDYSIDLAQSTKDNIQKGVDAKTTVDTKGLTFNGDSGSTNVEKLGSTVTVAGDDNITTEAQDDKVTVKLNKDLVVDSVKAGDTTVNNDGVKVAGGPSLTKSGIDAAGNKVTNVADGDLNANSKDAVNGSQLFATNQNVANNAANIAKGLNIAADNGSDDNVQLGETVAYRSSDRNIVTTVSDNQIDFKLAKDITVDSVTAGDSKLNSDGLTITGGPSVTKSGINAAGNKITNVAAGSDDTDAVNYSQLKQQSAAARTEVRAGTNIKDVVKTVDTNGQDVYTVNAKGTTASAGSSKLTVTAAEKADNVTDYSIDLADNTKAEIQKGVDAKTTVDSKGLTFSGDSGSTNIEKLGSTVTVAGDDNITTEAQDDKVTVKLKKDLVVNSVEAGDTTVNNDGVKVGDDVALTQDGVKAGDVKLTKDGLNNAGNKVTNVADGDLNANSKDAVNGSQLFATNQNVATNAANIAKGINFGGTTGSNNYALGDTINVKGDSNIISETVAGGAQLKLAKDITVDSVTAGDSKLNSDGLTITGGPSVTKSGINAAGNKITNVAAGTDDNDAVNYSQLKQQSAAARTEVRAGTNIKDVVKTVDTNGQDVYTVNAKGTTASAGSSKLTVTAAEKADNVTDYSIDLADNTKAEIQKGVDAKTTVDSKGLTFSGDSGSTNIEKLGSTVTVAGDDNITTEAQDDKVTVKLKKDLVVNSVEAGDTTVNNDGVKVGDDVALTQDGVKAGDVKLTKDGLNNAGNKVTNVADGDLNANSKDAVNGSQLFATNQNVATNAANIAKGINFGGTTGSNNYALGDTINVKGDSNIISETVAGGAQLKLAKDITVDSVTAGDSKLNSDGLTITGGPSVTKSGINAAGNKITNVAAGTDDNDAVNYSQLKQQSAAARTEVRAGTNIKDVVKTVDTNGQDVYTVNAKGTTASAGSSKLTVTAAEKADNVTDYSIDLADNTKAEIQKGVDAKTTVDSKGLTFSGDSGSTNIEKLGSTVTVAGDDNITTEAQDDKVTVKLKKDLVVNSVEAGDTTVNNDGVKVGDDVALTQDGVKAGDVKLTKDGLNNAGNKVTNVADGDLNANSKDAVNGSQLFATNQNVATNAANIAKGINFGGTTGSNNYALGDTINVKGDSNIISETVAGGAQLKLAKDITVDSVTAGDSKLNSDGLTITGGPSVTKSGIDAAGNKITNVAPGTDDADAVNYSQLKQQSAAARTEVRAGTNIKDVVKTTGANGQDIYTVNAKGTTASAGSDKVTVTAAAADANNVTDYSIDLAQNTKDDIQKGVDAKTTVDTKGLTFNGDSGSTNVEKLGSTVTVAGDDNITTEAQDDKVTVKLNKNLVVDSVKAGDATVNNDGVKIAGGPSLTKSGIDAAGNKVTNVADGDLNANSKDAVNGSQLFATNQNVANNAANIAKGINFGGTTGSNNYALGDTINVKGDSNIISETVAGGAQLKLAKDITVDSVTAGDSKLNTDGLTITGGPSVTKSGIDAAGNKITNVAPGTDDADAVNYSQLKQQSAAARTEVRAGTNIKDVVKTTGANGQDIYTVNAKGTTASAGSDKVTVTAAAADANNVTDYSIDLAQNTKDDIQKGVDAKTTVDTKGLTFNGDSGSTNVEKLGSTVTVAGDDNITTEAQDDKVTVKLNKDLVVDSVKAGDTTVNNDGVKVGDDVALTQDGVKAGDVKLTKDGLNNAGNKVTNVADGDLNANSKDAVNGSQLFATNQNVATNAANIAKGINFGGTTGSNNYALGDTINVKGDSNIISETVAGGAQLKLAKDITVDSVTAGDSKLNSDGLTITGGPSVTKSGINAAGNKITNVAAGTDDNDAVNYSQLKQQSAAARTEVRAGTNIKDVVKTVDTNGQDVYTVNAKGTTASAGSSKLTVTAAEKADNVTDYSIDLADNTKAEIQKGVDAKTTVDSKGLTFSGDSGSTNIEKLGSTVTVAGDDNITTEAQDDKVTVKLKKDLVVNSVEAGDTTVNNDGVKVGDDVALTQDGVKAGDVKLTKDGLNNAGNKVTNVADGDLNANSKDAVNGSQLFATNQNVATNAANIAKGINFGGTTGSNNYALGDTINVKGDSNIISETVAGGAQLKLAKDITVDSVTAGDSKLNSDGLTITGGPSVTKSGINAAGNKITNVAAGTDDNDAVNYSQLKQQSAAARTEVRAGTNIKDVVKTVDTNGQDVYTVNAKGTTASAGSSKLTVTAAEKADNVTDYSIDLADNTKAEIQKGVDAKTTVDSKGLTFSGDSGSTNIEKLGSTVTVAGDDNITTEAQDDKVTVKLKKDLVVNSVEAGDTTVNNDGVKVGDDVALTQDGVKAGDVKLTKDGLNNAGNKVTNVADGDLNANSKDAVNGSQLFATNQNVATNAANIAKGINFGGTTGSNNYALGDTINVKGDSNIISETVAGGAQLKLAKDITVDSVTAGDSKLNSDGLTITGGPSVTKSGINAAGNKITNVAAGTDDNDAVNYSQLKQQSAAARTEVRAGTNIKDVVKTVDTNGQDVYTVNAKGTTASAGSSKLTVTAAEKADNVTDYSIDLADNTKAEIQKGVDAKTTVDSKGLTFSGDSGSTNIEKLGSTVTVAGDDNITTEAQDDKVTVKLKKDLVVNSVEAGDTTVNNDGVKVGDDVALTQDGVKAGDVKLTKDGLNNAGNKVTNVADGDLNANSKDAVNGSQLFATNQNVATNAANIAKGINFGGTTGSNNYALGDTINVKGDSNIISETVAGGVQLKLAKDITVDSVTAGDSKLNSDGLTITGGPSVTKSGINAAGNKITNVAAGTDDNDAVNYSQLKQQSAAARTEVRAGTNIKDVVKTVDTNGQDVYTVNAKGTTASAGSSKLTVTAAEKADNVTDYSIDLADNTKAEIQKGVDAKTTVDSKGLTFSGDSGSTNIEKLGSTVTVAGDDNITTEAQDDKVTVKLKKDLVVNSVEAGDTTVNNDGVKVGDDVALTQDGVKAGDVKLTKDGLNNAGNKVTNVADGDLNANSKDAVNGSQLFATNQNVATNAANIAKGINFGGTTGSNNYALGDTINVKGDSNIISETVAGGAQLKLADVLNVGQAAPVKIDGDKGEVSGLSNTTLGGSDFAQGKRAATEEQLNAAQDQLVNVLGGNAANNGGNISMTDIGGTGENNIHDAIKAVNATANLPLTFGGDSGKDVERKPGTKLNIVGGQTDAAKLSDGNIGVVANGSDKLEVKLAKDLAVDSVKAGDTTVNTDGVKVGDVNLTKAGLNNGSNKITNVAAGTDDTDAVNVAQLNKAAAAAKTEVVQGDNIVVTQDVGANGQTIYKVATDKNLKVDSVTAGDTVMNNDGVKVGDDVALNKDGLKVGDVNLTKAGLNNGGNKITNIADGTDDTDAVNVSQLKQAAAASKTEVVQGKNIVVTQKTGDKGQTVYEVATDKDLDIDSVKAGNTAVNTDGVKVGDDVALNKDGLKAGKVNLTKDGLDNAGNKVTNVADGDLNANSKDAVNGSQLYATNQNVANNAATIAKGINFGGTTGSNNYALGSTINVKGDSNIISETVAGGAQLKLADEISVKTVNADTFKAGDTVMNNDGVKVGDKVALNKDGLTAGNTVVNNDGVTIAAPTENNPNNQVKLSPVGLNNGGQRITNVAPGKDGTDAANVNQLIGLGNELQNNINQVGKKAYAGVAGAIAQGSIPQVTRPGATGIGVGSGYYGGQSAMAIGVSAMSDGGNWIVKGNFSANTDGHVGVGAGALYQW